MLCLVLLLLAALGVGAVWGNRSLQVQEVAVDCPGLPAAFQGFRLAQVSDLHNATFGRDNARLLAALAQATPNLYLNDLCYLQAQHGMERFSDPTAWYAYKYAVSLECVPYLAQSVANIVKSLLGRNKKALALDLDNTLWGGVIGDDGPEGIVLGSESPAGMAYTEFQSYLKELSKLGVLLNVCSKNEEAVAKTGFDRPDSVLAPADFVSFKANWEPKHLNLAAMAAEINLLPESFVFVDDNPAEREIVRRELPAVTVPELTAPEGYIAAVDRAGYFEVTTLSADDRNRADMYKQNARRAQLEQSFGNYNDYLKSLEMRCEIGAFDAAHAERITQLVNKTNQFNPALHRRRDPGADRQPAGHHPVRPPGGQVRRQRPGHRADRPGPGRNAGHRAVGHELPHLQAPAGTRHVRPAGGRRSGRRGQKDRGALLSHRQKLACKGFLCYNRLCKNRRGRGRERRV